MKPRTFLVLLLFVALLASLAFALRGEGGGLTEWLRSLHGPAPRH
jgi:hypothetical protein